jgi:hypothetical protein
LEYRRHWGKKDPRPALLQQPTAHDHPFHSNQQTLFDPLWLRDPLEPNEEQAKKVKSTPRMATQLRLYWGPELVKRAG